MVQLVNSICRGFGQAAFGIILACYDDVVNEPQLRGGGSLFRFPHLLSVLWLPT